MGRTGGFRVWVRVEGELEPAWWSAYAESLVVTADADGTSRIEGSLVDQGAVLGVLGAVRDLGLTLVAVEIEREGQPNSDC